MVGAPEFQHSEKCRLMEGGCAQRNSCSWRFQLGHVVLME